MASLWQDRIVPFANRLSSAAGRLIVAIMFLALAGNQPVLAQTFQVVHNFAGGFDGSEPTSGFTMDAGGHFYGTTFQEDTGTGTVYKLTQRPAGWLLTPLYLFSGGSDGAVPYGRVVFGPNGSLYGTTGFGGIGPCQTWNDKTGCGTVYNLKPPPTRPATALTLWNESVLYDFSGGVDGGNPYGGAITFDQAGNMYGTTYNGGTGCTAGCGVVYKLTPSGSGWTESVLYTFGAPGDGIHPWAGVIIDTAGNLYGTTVYGGSHNFGTVYELSPSGSGYTETILYNFSGGADGGNPYADMIFDQAGNIYGATIYGGTGNGGTVFELTPSGGSWTLNTLYGFDGPQGKFVTGPMGNLMMDAAGNLYGTTISDGPYFHGTAFKLTPGSGGWTNTSLHDFTGGLDGGYPRSSLVFDSNGNLLGTASTGGTNHYGVVFEITP